MALLSRSESMASMNKRKVSPCQGDVDDGDSQAGQITRSSVADLPEDIWYHIHSLMPLRAAARAACLSRAFLRCWRCRPNLTFNRKMLLSKERAYAYGVNVSQIIDSILRNHSGTGLKVLKLELNEITNHRLGSWLRVAVTPTIEELTVVLSNTCTKIYRFPCSVLSNTNGVGNSIRHLELGFCAFHPTAEFGPLRNLTSLSLRSVYITGDELECFISNCLALERLYLRNWSKIICLEVSGCWRLRVIESKAPNLSSLCIVGKVKLSLGETLKMKRVSMFRSRAVCYARVDLSSIMPNLESLDICSSNEVCDQRMEHESVFGGSSDLRQILEHHHRCLRNVKMTGFSSAKSLVELRCYIIKNAMSLECLSLNTLDGFRCSGDAGSRTRIGCVPQSDSTLRKVTRAAAAFRMYIEDTVPSTVK